MKYKIGDKVKIIATDKQLEHIGIYTNMGGSGWPDIKHHELYHNRKGIYTITNISNDAYYNNILCPYCLNDYSWFPEKYLSTREDKLKRILKDEI